MQTDFELFLVLATLLSGIIVLIDIVYLSKHRKTAMPKWVEYGHSFFPVLLIVLLLRSFLVEPFRIPSGSLEPSLLPGDFVVANKFAYGLRLPVSHVKFLSLSEPQTGEIAIFRDPQDPDKNLIKRVIGKPGDTISYINKVIYINGVEQPQRFIGHGYDVEGNYELPVDIYEENLNGVKHLIYINPAMPVEDGTYVVPKGEYFMMGDNRDNSDDSRSWGCMPESALIGKAFLVMFSWDDIDNTVRWKRVGQLINGHE